MATVNTYTEQNTPRIAKITLPNGNSYYLKDAEVRQLLWGTYDSTNNNYSGGGLVDVVGKSTITSSENSHESRITTIEGQIEALISGSLTYHIVETLPTASASTTGSIYMIANNHGTSNYYDEYMTIKSGESTYNWEKIGSTDIDLSNYAQKGDGITVSSGTAASAKTNISLSAHSVTSATTSASGKFTPSGTNAASSVTITPSTTNVYSMTSAGSVTAGKANTPTVIDTTKFSGGSYSHSGFSGGSFTEGTFTANTPTVIDTSKFNKGSFTNGTLAAFSATVSNEILTLSWTAPTANSWTGPSLSSGFYTAGTAASKAADSFTAASYGTDSFTAASLESGFYTAGTANTPTAVTLPGRSTAIAAWTGYTAAEAAAQDFTGTEGTVSTTGTASITIANHTITDNGHTHSVTGSGTINS